MYHIGIRQEDKNRWERRAPLTPGHVRELVRDRGLRVAVEPSPFRVYPDDDYRAAGATLTADLTGCRAILCVKEVPIAKLVPDHPYLMFSHVIKGQAYNMPLLRRFLTDGCTLIDYESIVDRYGERLIFFGRHAGYAGMIDGLWTLGRRLAERGVDTAFAGVEPAHRYRSVAAATDYLTERVGRRIREVGIAPELHPLVIGFTGGGNVSQGAQQILEALPIVEVDPDDLPAFLSKSDISRHAIYKVVFRRMHREHFARHLPHLTLLVNGIYWQPATPRLVSQADLVRLWAGGRPKLEVIADISCDVEGSIEATVRATTPDDPVYVYDPATGGATSGFDGPGPAIMAVDNLPAELPRDATDHFGDSLYPFIGELAAAAFDRPFEHLALPAAILGATVTHKGELTPEFRYLEDYLREAGA